VAHPKSPVVELDGKTGKRGRERSSEDNRLAPQRPKIQPLKLSNVHRIHAIAQFYRAKVRAGALVVFYPGNFLDFAGLSGRCRRAQPYESRIPLAGAVLPPAGKLKFVGQQTDRSNICVHTNKRNERRADRSELSDQVELARGRATGRFLTHIMGD
jgi:hypothetical protein